MQRYSFRRVAAFSGLAFVTALLPLTHTHAQSSEKSALSADQKAALAGLAPEDRDSVVMLNGDGTVYASKPALKSEIRSIGKGRATGGLTADTDGNTFSLPNDGASLWAPDRATRGISKSHTTGPFHGVYSHPGYGYEEANVYLPSADTFPPSIMLDEKRSGDTAYVYMGGESRRGGAVDAGFQHSKAKDNWSLFLKCEGFGFHYNAGLRFASNQSVHLKFYIPADNVIAVSARGKDMTGQMVTRVILLDVSHYPQSTPPAPSGKAGQPTRYTWLPGGHDAILKRVTSIAQFRQRFDSRSFSKDIRWQGLQIGTSPSKHHAWSNDDDSGSTDWPDTRRVVVHHNSSNDETVNILLIHTR